MAAETKNQRRVFLLAGYALAALTLFRLSFLVRNSWDQSPAPPSPAEVLVDKEVALRVEGASGETIRIFLPEVPVGLDTPFGNGQIVSKVKLKLKKAPTVLVCQVIKGGVVVAQSKPLPLKEGAKLDLGVVKVERSP